MFLLSCWLVDPGRRNVDNTAIMRLQTQQIYHLCKSVFSQPAAFMPAIPLTFGVVSKAWEEDKHPRGGAGTAEGGRFVSGSGTPTVTPSDKSTVPAGEGGKESGVKATPIDVTPRDGVGEQPTVPIDGPGKQTPHAAESPLDSMRDKFTGTGAKDDPIVTKDVLVAAAALHEDRYVRLESKRQVSVLLDKIKEMVDDAKAKGQKAGVYDLCKVTLTGSSLFCVESKGVPRVQMPQIKGVPTPGSKADALPKDKSGEVNLAETFIKQLKEAGVGVTLEKERADFLKPSQNELNGGKVSGMAAALESGKANHIREDPIFCSAEGFVLDGHHRWCATVGVDLRKERGEGEHLTMNILRCDLGIIDLIKAANNFATAWGIPQASVAKVKKSGCGNGGCAVLSDADIVRLFADGQTV